MFLKTQYENFELNSIPLNIFSELQHKVSTIYNVYISLIPYMDSFIL